MEINIRRAEQKDLAVIVAIYNQAIATKISTAETIPVSVKEKQEWFDEHTDEKYPLLVAEYNHNVIGWISISAYRKGRQGLQHTAEVSYYIHNNYLQKGIGSLLMETIILKAKELGYKNLIAIIIDANTASIKLLKKFRFEQWGLMPGIIEIENKVYDHGYYGRKI
ncbi:MAG: N-acetyltransferase family protein [Sphingobacteriales bacterium]